MSNTTPNLLLLKKDPVADSSDLFSIKTMLNDNWDKIDSSMLVSVKAFGAKGDGINDDTAAIQSAIDVVKNAGGGCVFFPKGIYISAKLTTYNNVYLVGEGRSSIIKLKDGTNDNLIEGYQSSTLWGSGTNGGLTHYGLKDLELDGNRANNTAGSCLAVYGEEPYILNLSIKNAPEYGMRTEFGDAESEFGMEGYIANLKIDRSGKHGWYSKGPHDTTAIGVIIIDSGLIADNTYDAFHLEPGCNGRFIGCHAWNRSTAPARHRYALYDASWGGNEFTACHFEGAVSGNVCANSADSTYIGCRMYSAWNGKNVIIKQPTSLIGCHLGGPGSGRPDCVGIILGESSSDNASNCLIQVKGGIQRNGFIDFTYSKGGNDIVIQGWNDTGTGYKGTPNANDTVRINISGIGTHLIQRYS